MAPPRTRPGSRNAFAPPNDAATYRDVLMFEERLKSNAVSLQRRKSRYQFFLLQLLIVIAVLLWEVLLPPQASVLVIPYRLFLQWTLPSVFPPEREVEVHPYISSGLLFVSVTTLLLFFASGMYSEKIAYANKYVPHANKALRNFNMVLNVRKPPLRSQLPWNPLNFFFPRPPEAPSSARLRSPSPSRSSSSSSSARSRSSSVSRPMASLPPASSPRGELVFSSKVDRGFREGYERYRGTFERKRQEKLMAERRKTWWGKLIYWRQPPVAPPGSVPQVTTSPSTGTSTAVPSRLSTPSRPTRLSRSTTPAISDSDESGGIMMRSRGGAAGSPAGDSRGDTPSRGDSPSPPSTPPQRDRPRRESNMRTLALERSFEHSRGEL